MFPAGLDATINTGTIDFKWSNNTEAPVYVFTWIDKEQKRIWCEIYGLPFAAEAGFDEIELISERLPDIEPTADEYITYSGLTAPYWMLKNAAKTGYVYDTFKSYKLNGTEVRREDSQHRLPYAPQALLCMAVMLRARRFRRSISSPLPQKNNEHKTRISKRISPVKQGGGTFLTQNKDELTKNEFYHKSGDKCHKVVV